MRVLQGAIAIVIACAHSGFASDSLLIVYPKPNQTIAAVDSTFIFGQIKADTLDLTRYKLLINDTYVPLHRDGGFLAFLPLAPGQFVFRLKATFENRSSREKRELVDSVVVNVPMPVQSLPDSGFEIKGDYRPPSGDLVLRTGERLDIAFHGSPGRIAWCSLPGAFDSLPMIESEPRQQPYWGESVFGSGRVPDSLLIRGIYSTSWIVPESVSVDTSSIRYVLGAPRPAIAAPAPAFKQHLKAEQPKKKEKKKIERKPPTLTPAVADTIVTRNSGYRVSVNPVSFPFVARLIDTNQIIRHAPRLGYFSIYQPMGVELQVVGAEGDWYKAQLSETQFAWLAKSSVLPLAKGTLLPKSSPTVVRTRSFADSVRVECSLSGKHPFRIAQLSERQLQIRLYGVTSNIDWIRYDFADSLVQQISWEQIEPGCLALTIELSSSVWGYDGYYDKNQFVLMLHKPPANLAHLTGKKIMIDPGHSADNGAVGPTGLTEKEANLALSLLLAELLRKKGAEVIMTRSDTSHVPLASRPQLAKAASVDLFVSVHNNALPDGVNPFVNNGVATFYYHPHSLKLAKSIQTELLAAQVGKDYGLYHGNLLVNRATQYPAVLVECAFMMIPEQEAALKSEPFRLQVAKAITAGIERFFKDAAHGK